MSASSRGRPAARGTRGARRWSGFALLVAVTLVWGFVTFQLLSFVVGPSSSGNYGAFLWLLGALMIAVIGAILMTGWLRGPLPGFAVLALVAVVIYGTCRLTL